jgi:hypothetical protein
MSTAPLCLACHRACLETYHDLDALQLRTKEVLTGSLNFLSSQCYRVKVKDLQSLVFGKLRRATHGKAMHSTASRGKAGFPHLAA